MSFFVIPHPPPLPRGCYLFSLILPLFFPPSSLLQSFRSFPPFSLRLIPSFPFHPFPNIPPSCQFSRSSCPLSKSPSIIFILSFSCLADPYIPLCPSRPSEPSPTRSSLTDFLCSFHLIILESLIPIHRFWLTLFPRSNGPPQIPLG